MTHVLDSYYEFCCIVIVIQLNCIYGKHYSNAYADNGFAWRIMNFDTHFVSFHKIMRAPKITMNEVYRCIRVYCKSPWIIRDFSQLLYLAIVVLG